VSASSYRAQAYIGKAEIKKELFDYIADQVDPLKAEIAFLRAELKATTQDTELDLSDFNDIVDDMVDRRVTGRIKELLVGSIK